MEQTIRHGAKINAATPDEVAAEVQKVRIDREQRTHIRAGAQVQLDATGSGVVEVYKVPLGDHFSARRIFLTLNTIAANPNTNGTQWGTGRWAEYRRSGTLLSYANTTWNNLYGLPGSETWGDQQGPELENGEVFEIAMFGVTASALLIVMLEGILIRPFSNVPPRRRINPNTGAAYGSGN